MAVAIPEKTGENYSYPDRDIMMVSSAMMLPSSSTSTRYAY